MLRGVDFDDCLVSTTRWHKREHELVGQFGVSPVTAVNLYEMSKVKVKGRVEGESRYTPRLNLALLTAFTDLLGLGRPEEKAFEKVSQWRETLAGFIHSQGEEVIGWQKVNSLIRDAFLGNHISHFLYRDFANAVFSQHGDPALRFIVTRGKIEGSLGQVHKVHASGVLQKPRNVHMVIYTNDIKAETLIYLSSLLSDRARRKPVYLFDDNVAEIIPYLDIAQKAGMRNILVVQVAHPDAKRRDAKIGLEPVRIIGRESTNELVLRYFTADTVRLTPNIVFPR